MRINSSYKLGLLGVIATLLALGGHGLLPEKRLTIHRGSTAEVTVYSDQMIGGESRASWIDEQQLHWRCDIKESAAARFCGLHLVLFPGGKEGVDLSSYEAIRVKLTAETSDSRVRIFFRNHEQGFSEEGNLESAKFLNALIPIGDLGDEFSVNLQEFSVAEWWIAERNVPRRLAFPKFNDIRAIGVDLGVPPVVGVHELKLERMYFVGEWIPAEKWYRGILFSWVGALTLFSLYRYVQLRRRLALEEGRLEDIAKNNSELKSESDKYRELSVHDKLTGTLNRRGFDQVMEQLSSELGPAEELALLVIDLDHFKRINDNRGHDVGDQVLVGVTELLRDNLGSEDALARWGGEEFLVLSPRLNMAGAQALAEKLRVCVADARLPIDPPLRVTASIGFGCFTRSDDFEAVFVQVDAALYRAKTAGRNQTSASVSGNPQP